jgi:hypothetical protein
MKQELINKSFAFDPPTEEQLNAMRDVTVAAKIYAETLNKHIPETEEKKTVIIHNVECTLAEALMMIYVPCNGYSVTDEDIDMRQGIK